MKQQRLIAISILIFCLFNFPILSLFNKNKFIFGIPLIYFYVFAIWLIGILIVAFFAEKRNIDRKIDE
jgi:hypothetical protein